MTSARQLEELPVPAGKRALAVLPVLRRVLDGAGPALLPVAHGAPEARHVTEVLAPGTALTPGEDDEGDPTALVVATSGSTGVPKGVLLSVSALVSSARATHEHLGGPGNWLLAMPAHHIAGLQVLIRSLVAGTTPAVVDTNAGFRVDRFAEAARGALASAGPHYTSLVPTQLARLLDAGTTGSPDGLAALREFDAVLLGGAATPPAVLQRAHDAGVSAVTTYGMSETAGGCVYDGVPLTGARVHIDGDTSGPVNLAGPMLARGYRGAPQASAAAFACGWFHTGDLGRWRNDGTLDVLGRADDVIITGGVNVAPTAVERILTEHAGVREACVVGIADDEWGQIVVAAIVPADPAVSPSVDELRSEVRERSGAAATPKRIMLVGELPLLGPGKPDREALREALAP